MTATAEWSAQVDIRPTTPEFGAVVEGVDGSRPLSDDVAAALREAILRYKVLFFRDQHLTARQQFDLAANFGEPFDGGAGKFNPEYDEVGVSAVRVVPHFHADFMYMDAGPTYSLLQMLELPDVGGDTMWADLDASYHALSEPLQQFLAPLTATHVMPNYYLPDDDLLAVHKRSYAEDLNGEQLRELRNVLRPREHPLVRRIPETGTVNYWLSEQHTKALVGLSKWESDAVLNLLFRHQLRPEFVLRWRWAAGDIAMWDHRRTLHSGVNDYGQGTRRARRASVGPNSPQPARRD